MNEENSLHEDCPKCDRHLDEVDYEYQMCSKCGYNIEKGEYSLKLKREPNESDYSAGEADILTGRWF